MRIRECVILALSVVLISAVFPAEGQAVRTRLHILVERPIGADFGHGVALTPGGNSFYTAGAIATNSQARNIWFRKYTTHGKVLWTKKLDGPDSGSDWVHGVAATPDGSLYLVGDMSVASNWTDMWVGKYSSSGAKMWTRRVQGEPDDPETAFAVAAAPDGGAYVAGRLSVSGQGTDIWLRRYTPSGKTAWTRKYNRDNLNDEARGVTVDPNGNVYVCGSIWDSGDGKIFWMRKYSPAGKKRWDAVSTQVDECTGVDASPKGAIYVVGTTGDVGPNHEDGWIRKYSRKGKELWTRTYNGKWSDEDRFNGVAATPGGGVCAVGFRRSSPTWHDHLLVKYSAKGDFKWQKAKYYAQGRGVAVAPNGDVYTIGEAYDNDTPDIFIQKFR
jgi:hypothetical protein